MSGISYLNAYNEWLESEFIDEQTKVALLALKGNDKEIEESFHKSLEFGTGGLRGIIGPGTNRMNIYTIMKATQGLSNYILKKNIENASVAISYDSRHKSAEFAEVAALNLCANGIKAYVFDALRPTPELSFAVRKLDCTAGIMITASHNPSDYNGYKAYWSDGAQIPFPMDGEIIDEVNAIGGFGSIKKISKEEATKSGLYVQIGQEIDEEYLKNVHEQLIFKHDELIEEKQKLKIVYTPFNGAGNVLVRRALHEAGFSNVHVVAEQELPDPDFKTVGYPNPEDPKAFELANKLASEVGADLTIATDPDSDRVGIVIKDKNGDKFYLSGNMTGTLLAEYLLSKKKESGLLPSNSAIVSTVVSTRLTKEIAEKFGVKYFDVFTGFKFIGEKIKEFDATKSHEFVFGFEESYGYLSGSYCRDKDAVSSTLLVCEMAAYYLKNGKTVYDGLLDLYEKYGYYYEANKSFSYPGIEGLQKMSQLMQQLRTSGLKVINNKKVTKFIDYSKKTVKDFELDISYDTGMPPSDVLYFALSDGSWFCVRPSGTEPKIKIYTGVMGSDFEDAIAKSNELLEAIFPLVA